jgi:hypothetical protein
VGISWAAPTRRPISRPRSIAPTSPTTILIDAAGGRLEGCRHRANALWKSMLAE